VCISDLLIIISFTKEQEKIKMTKFFAVVESGKVSSCHKEKKDKERENGIAIIAELDDGEWSTNAGI
jgi:hypothetical protein